MDLMEIGCEDESWMELAEDRVHWWDLVVAVLLDLGIILAEG
jgi:hypothetical protein